MNSFFFSRADWEDLQTRQRTKSLEWIHTPSDSLGPFASSFSSVMNSGQHLYFPLPGLCWDIVNCNDQAWQDNPALTNYNVPAMVANVVAQIKEQAGRYVGDVYLTQGACTHRECCSWSARFVVGTVWSATLHVIRVLSYL